MLKFREISVRVLEVVTFKSIIYSTLVNFVGHETHNYAMVFFKKSIISNVCKVHVLLGRIYGIDLKQSQVFHLIRPSRQSGEDTQSRLCGHYWISPLFGN